MTDLNQTTLWTALVTPMTTEGRIDYDALSRLVRAQEEAGNGILVLGSTGEGANLTESERRQVVRFVSNLKPSVPLMVGVGGIQLEETLEWLDFCEGMAIDAYLMVTPLYAKPGAEGQFRWFSALMDRVSRPCMLYNVPGRTGCPLSLDAVERLRGHLNLWSIKEASGDPEVFAETVRRLPGVRVFSGDDGLMPIHASLAASGLVSVLANARPREAAAFVTDLLSGGNPPTESWVRLASALFVASNPIPVKHLMAHHGTIETGVVRAPLHLDDMVDDSELLAADEPLNALLEAVA